MTKRTVRFNYGGERYEISGYVENGMLHKDGREYAIVKTREEYLADGFEPYEVRGARVADILFNIGEIEGWTEKEKRLYHKTVERLGL